MAADDIPSESMGSTDNHCKGQAATGMNRIVKFILTGVLFVLIASIVILSAVPPVSRDALTHHLAIPKLYLKHGGIYEIPHIVFSYFPMNVDLLYLIPLYFGNDIAPKYIHFSFALLTAGLIYNFLKKRTNSLCALLGALFFLSIPIIVKLSITVYVDLGLAFFSTAAIIYVFKWLEDQFRLKHLIISGCWCGLALGTKYNGLVILLLLTLFVPYIYIRKKGTNPYGQVRAAGYGVIFMAVALLIFSPWMIRNYLWKHNPIYPLYHNWFSQNSAPAAFDSAGKTDVELSGKSIKKLTLSNQKVGLFAYRQIVYNESWWQIALVPVRVFFSGRDNDPRHFDGKLTPFLFLLPFLAFVRSSEKRPTQETEKWVLLTFSLLFILIAFFTVEMRIRYLVPIIPPLVMLSILGLYRLHRWIHARFSTGAETLSAAAMTAVAGALLLISAAYIFEQFGDVRPFDFLSGRVGRDAYIEIYCKEYPVVQYANQNLAEDARILSIFLGHRIYYSDKTMISDPALLLHAVKSSHSPQMISMDLKKKGLSHLMVRMDLFNGWIDNNFDENKKELISLFIKEQMRLLFYKNGYGLFEIR